METSNLTSLISTYKLQNISSATQEGVHSNLINSTTLRFLE